MDSSTDNNTDSSTDSRRPAPSRVVEGWAGRLFEDFAVGDIYYHPFGKTVTQADNQSFTLMTQNVSKTHVDANFGAKTEFGRPLVNSTLTLALVTGQSTIDLSMNVFANMGWDEVRMPNPVYEGDTIYSRSKVLALRGSKSRPTLGLVTVATEGYNQDSTIVISYRRTFMVYRVGHLPGVEDSRPDESSLPDTEHQA
ncbi:MaoC family dehydratase [Specibacter cremeus]|uniref:MaoC family dehydratase n=1 Tax=Specibacter cremeus TaxID=1629051 RepID=UPI000F7A5164|nr:MaoC family dehydratase [Specibacter cremeus]